MDVLTGGAGGDTFVFAAGDNGDAPESKIFDTITDFGAGDIIDFDTTLTIDTVSAEPTAGRASISATGLATFKSSDSTLSLRLSAVEDAMTNGSSPTAGEVATFTVGGDSYLFVSDATAGLSPNDVLIKLQNKSMTGLVLDSGNVVVPYTVSEFNTSETATLIGTSDLVYIADGGANVTNALATANTGLIAKLANIDSISTNNATPVTLTKAQFADVTTGVVTALTGKMASSSIGIDATSATANLVASLATNIAKVATGGITGALPITNALAAADITALFAKTTSTTATVDATSMTAAKLAAVATSKVGNGGITNLTSLALNDANISIPPVVRVNTNREAAC